MGDHAAPAGRSRCMPPIHLATTTATGPPSGERLAGYEYQREGNLTNDRLREALKALEGGEEAMTFASGMAAMATLLESLPAGSRVLFPDDCYTGLRMLFAEVPAGRGSSPSRGGHGRPRRRCGAACAQPLAMLWIETLSNPLLKVCDIAALADIRERGRGGGGGRQHLRHAAAAAALALGADIVMHSTTKYFGGHSDVLGGAWCSPATTPSRSGVRIACMSPAGDGAVQCGRLTCAAAVRQRRADGDALRERRAPSPCSSATHPRWNG